MNQKKGKKRRKINKAHGSKKIKNKNVRIKQFHPSGGT